MEPEAEEEMEEEKSKPFDSLLKKSFNIALSISSALFNPYLNPCCLLAPG